MTGNPFEFTASQICCYAVDDSVKAAAEADVCAYVSTIMSDIVNTRSCKSYQCESIPSTWTDLHYQILHEYAYQAGYETQNMYYGGSATLSWRDF